MFGKLVKRYFDNGKKALNKGLANLDSETMAEVGLDIERQKLEDVVKKLVSHKRDLEKLQTEVATLSAEHAKKASAAQILMKDPEKKAQLNAVLSSMEKSKRTLDAKKVAVTEKQKTVDMLQTMKDQRQAGFDGLKDRLDKVQSAVELSKLKKDIAKERAELQKNNGDTDSGLNDAIAAMEGAIDDNTAEEEVANIMVGNDTSVDAILAEVAVNNIAQESDEERLARLMG